jgi:hypothetical protein
MRAAAWAQLFAQNDPLTLLKALAGAIGFQEAARLDARTQESLGIAEEVHPVILARGPGTTRLVGAVAQAAVPLREQAARLADRLSRAAPHLLWLLVLAARDRREIAIASWHAGSGPVRIAALIVDGHGVLPSDAETLDALKATLRGIADLEVHAQWVEILGREAISRRFFLALEQLVRRLGDGALGGADPRLRREVSLLYVSRLLFLAFLQERGWLDGDRRFLARAFDDCMTTGGHFQRRVLRPLFFGTLNTPLHRRAPLARALGRIPFLNGGLFTRSAIEGSARALVMRDEDFGELFDQLLVRYRFTPREETSNWQEAAIDPEILGRAFESLMASRERRVTGAFYTPLTIVTRVADAGLEAALVRRGATEGIVDRVAANETLTTAESGALRKALGGLRVLDPACGSGAFLVHLLDRLTRLRLAAGDGRSPSTVRREVLSQCVFGVDVNPTAVWLCELRLWLSLAMEHPATDPGEVPPLPNLDHNIRCGDALLAGDFAVVPGPSRDGRAGLVRARYARATGARKRHLARALDRLERSSLIAWLESRLGQVAAQRRSLVVAARGRDLFGGRRGTLANEREEARQLRVIARELRSKRRAVLAGGALPFVFAAHFPEAARAGGFDVIAGNPPWIRLHHIPVSMREALRREFRVYREAAWVAGAKAARAGAGFGSQVDAASLFVERSHQLLRGDGVMSLLLPAKLWRSLAGGGVRRLLTERANLLALEDWTEAPAMFDAATYPSLMVAARSSAPAANGVRLAVHRGRLNIAWDASRAKLPLDESAGAPWVTLPPDAREAFDRLARNGVALAASGLGVATLGVKCGCNDAYLVTSRTRDGGVEVFDGVRSAVLDAGLVRRVVRGEGVRAWRAVEGGESMVFPHADDGRALDRLPPTLRNWLLPWRSRLEARSDARGHKAWWSLFRLEGSRFDRPRVVWADMGRSLQALVLEAGDRTVPLNTCYVLATRDLVDAMALAALLNSPVADAWIGAIAEPARGRYRRHFAWTMARLPVPDDWARARDILAPLGERGLRGERASRSELLTAVLDAFRMRHRTIAPLIEWIGH